MALRQGQGPPRTDAALVTDWPLSFDQKMFVSPRPRRRLRSR
jgi:hypothetical protein